MSQPSVLIRTLAFILQALLAASDTAPQPALGAWRTARSTFFGADAWNVHQGSCGYNTLYQDEPLGWSVAALPDVDAAYPDSCGRCLELACVNMPVTDGYNATVDRSAACYDTSASVIVRVTDTCPCYYPTNMQSNKRWCCGDMNHVDASVWAWERLADRKWGVIGIKYRAVPCDYQPTKLAPPSPNPTPMSGAMSMSASGKRVTRDWPEYWPNTVNPQVIYQGGIWPPWTISNINSGPIANPSLQPMQQAVTPISPFGTPEQASTPQPLVGPGSPLCATLQGRGSVTLSTTQLGLFSNRISLIMWVYMGDITNDGATLQARRNVLVSIGNSQGTCRTVNLNEVRTSGYRPCCVLCSLYWWRFEIFLNSFTAPGSLSTLNTAQAFRGCSGLDAGALTTITITNPSSSSPFSICFDHIQLN